MTITVAVSGINAIDNPGPGTGIIRSLKESDLDIRAIGLAYDSMEPGIYMKELIDYSYIMPYPSGEKQSFLNRLAYIHSREKIDIIIPALDAELPLYIALENEIKAMGIKMLIPTKKMFELRNKSRLKEVAEKIDIKIPIYYNCNSREDLMSALPLTGFPCMIKGPFYEAFKANSYPDAEAYFNKIAVKWGYPIIVQQFVVGDEFNVIGCGNGVGENMGLFAMRKMTTTGLGKVWNAVSIQNEKLLKKTADLVEELKWQGGFEFEVIIDSSNGDIYLIEINPRFPAWVYMASSCGVNLPARMVKYLLSEEYQSHSDYKSGQVMIRYTWEVVKDMSEFAAMSTNGEA